MHCSLSQAVQGYFQAKVQEPRKLRHLSIFVAIGVGLVTFCDFNIELGISLVKSKY